MPATHVVSVTPQVPLYTVKRKGKDEPVNVIKEDNATERVYVSYVNLGKRMDEWVPLSLLEPIPGTSGTVKRTSRKRKRTTPASNASGSRNQSIHSDEEAQPEEQNVDMEDSQQQEIVMTEEDYDIQHHKQIGAVRNFDRVHFGQWSIRTWYYSPYPFADNEDPDPASSSNSNANRIPGVSRSVRHARTSDLLAGGLSRSHKEGEKSILWVCEMCFKYMIDGLSWESHKKVCQVKRPPGRKVYQRGAHTIWEVDGAKDKLYCQNLSLFGKLFIDIKTLFFDLDNFLFYILTDASAEKDHMMGYFCKEKVSFDGYNLACITTLPPFQKQGFGMLMIEFSYELSRRSGQTGTPERPLSDLGLRSYLAYWIATLVRFFRKLLSVLPQGTTKIYTTGTPPDLSGRSREASEDGFNSPNPQRRRKKHKGWDGEISHIEEGADLIDIDENINSLRSYVTTSNPDGSASTHLQVQCSLTDISRATNLRVEDAAFALNEMGMLRRWGKPSSAPSPGVSSPVRSNGARSSTSAPAMDFEDEYVIVLTRELVEKVAAERNVKPPCIQMKHVLL